MDISDFDIISDVFEKLIFLFTVIDECSTCKMTILYMNWWNFTPFHAATLPSSDKDKNENWCNKVGRNEKNGTSTMFQVCKLSRTKSYVQQFQVHTHWDETEKETI